jgi:hypothetical protein
MADNVTNAGIHRIASPFSTAMDGILLRRGA